SGTSDVGAVALDEQYRFSAVRSGESSTADGIVAILGQAESVIAADVELHVAVAGHRAVVEGVVLIEVAEGDDAGVAGAGAGTGTVVGDRAGVVGVVGGIIFQADAVVGLDTVLDRWRIEGVIAGGGGFEGSGVGAGGIDGQVGNGAVGGGNQLKAEGSVIETSGAGGTRILVGDGHVVDGQVALVFKPHGG